MTEISAVQFGEMLSEMRHLAKSSDKIADTCASGFASMTMAINELRDLMQKRAPSEDTNERLEAIETTYLKIKWLVFGVVLYGLAVTYGLWDALAKLKGVPLP